MDQLMAIDKVAEVLDISPRQVWREIAGGNLPKPVKIGRSSKLAASDIQKFIDSLKLKRTNK